MASSNGDGSEIRPVKELKIMISANGPNQDVDMIQANLNKLKMLAKDDKTETAMLRARIDEQSKLICILKQRADKALTRTLALEQVNGDLETFRNSAQEVISAEVKKVNLINRRFNELAENHEEMIRIKDEYKRANKGLSQENILLQEQNSRLFSSAISVRDEKIESLQNYVTSLKEQCKELNEYSRRLKEELTEQERALKGRADKLEKELGDSQRKLQSVQSQLKLHSEKAKNSDANTCLKIERLSKEKDEMLELAMHRGKLIQDKQREIKELHEKVSQAEREIRNLEDKFEREAATVSANLQVIRLKDEKNQAQDTLKSINLEYEAYKKHTRNLLAKEKSLNAQLRNLVS